MEFPQKESDQGDMHESKLLSYTWLVITPSHTHCLEPGVKRELMGLWPVINQNPRKTKGFLQLRDGWSLGEHYLGANRKNQHQVLGRVLGVKV